jgi:SWI/SNF-related matrix-associated actin-dependent regulator of chromatin subfamily D
MLDDQLAILVQAISHHKARHAFFKSFSKDPIAFLRKWYASQQHDMSVLLGEVEKWDIAGLEFAKSGPDGVWGDRGGNDGLVREVVRGRLGRESIAR